MLKEEFSIDSQSLSSNSEQNTTQTSHLFSRLFRWSSILFFAVGSERLQPRKVNRIPSLLLCFGSSLLFHVHLPLVSFFFFSLSSQCRKVSLKDWTDEEISVMKVEQLSTELRKRGFPGMFLVSCLLFCVTPFVLVFCSFLSGTGKASDLMDRWARFFAVLCVIYGAVPSEWGHISSHSLCHDGATHV